MSTLLKEVLDELGGEDGAQLLGSQDLTIKIKGVIPTGCPSVDAAIGRGGIPLARLTIIHGKEGSGKTTMALHIVQQCQAQGGIVIYMDMEYKLDPDYAVALGVDVERMIIVQPPHLEKIFQKIEKIIKRARQHSEKSKKNPPILIVIDSMNAAITKAQYTGDFEDQPHYGPQATVYSKLLPKMIPIISKSQVALLFVSQVRKNIGVTFGNDETICGGNAPRFYASLIMGVTSLSATKDADGTKTSNKIRVDCFKNQIAPPFQKGECEIVYGTGVDKERSLIWIAEKKGLVKKKGAWFKYGDKKLGQGATKAAEHLRSHPGVRERLLADLAAKYKWEDYKIK